MDEEKQQIIFKGNPLKEATGLIMLDDEVVPVPGGESIDLLGAHYLQQLNSWLYLGLGVHAPLVYGNYGGFMAFDATVHAQRKLIGNLFIDGGASFGGGGGGSSVKQSKKLTGTGGFVKSYAGVGYDFQGFSAGINYTHFRFVDSLINHSQLSLFVQKPVSYAIGSYAYSGYEAVYDEPLPENGENMLTLELNNLLQQKPQGSIKETIHTLSLQFSRFVSDEYYMFFGADVGYKGLPLYNQVLGGMGYRLPLSSRFNLYSQLGIGSGGYSPVEVDTGSGLLVYPKISAEYRLDQNLSLSLSGGYLAAPKGSFKNYTLGAALNFHLADGDKYPAGSGMGANQLFKGFRVSAFQQTEFDVRERGKEHADINLLSAKLDYILSDHWYIPTQISVAYNEFLGYPGYGEALVGVGVQSRFSAADSFQGFFQILTGANVHGIVLKPAVGLNYSHSDEIALYAQLGKTVSLNKLGLYPDKFRLTSSSFGLGLTYRFSVL